MKKFRVVLIAMLMIAMLASTAFAASVSSAHYSNGRVTYTISNLEGKFAQVLIDGVAYDMVTPDCCVPDRCCDGSGGCLPAAPSQSAQQVTS